MRAVAPLLAAAVVLTVATTAGAATSPACAAAEAAVAHLAERGGDPLLFSTGFSQPARTMFESAKDGRTGLPSGVEAKAALQRFEPAKLRPALDCVNARARADAKGEVAEDAPAQARLQAMGLNGRTAYLWRILMPVLDAGGREAVVAAYASSNQLAGGAELLFLARQRDGSWKITGRRILSMS